MTALSAVSAVAPHSVIVIANFKRFEIGPATLAEWKLLAYRFSVIGVIYAKQKALQPLILQLEDYVLIVG